MTFSKDNRALQANLTHMFHLLPCLSYFAGSKSVSACQSDPDTMTNTALEAMALSSGKNVI